jgi:4-cresol dehydrogenase (hydroxylating)
MPNPGGRQTSGLTFQNDDDLHHIIETIRPLRTRNIIPNVPHLRHIVEEASVYGSKKFFYNREGPIPDDRIEELIVPKLNMGRFTWALYMCVYGPEVIRKANIEVIRDSFFKVPGAKKISLKKHHRTIF